MTPDRIASPPLPAAMTVPEFCQWARSGRTAVYREIKAGRLVLRKVGAKSLILTSDAEAWLRSLPTAKAIEELDRKAQPGKPRRSTSDVSNEPVASAKSDLGHQGADLDAETA